MTAAARLSGIQVLTSVMNAGSATTPLTDKDQADFASYAASVAHADPDLTRLIIGNEPNLNRYWLPQFNADGSDAAAPAYESLLAKTYDAVKAVAPTVTVIGGAVSPRGSDNPLLTRQTHSPTGFIQDLGTAYRASGRTTPIMDAFAFHPYEDDSSVAPATGVHPNSTTIALADYGKLVTLLGDGVRRNRAGRLDAADLLRRVRRRVADPGGEAGAVHGDRAGDDEARRRGDAGDVLPSGDPARVLPAERPRALPLPRVRRDVASGLAVGPVLRGRHAEDEPRAGPRGDAAVASRRRRGVPGDAA